MGFNELFVRVVDIKLDEICKIFHACRYMDQFRDIAIDADLEA